MIRFILGLLVACSQQGDPAAASLAPPPADPAAALEACGQVPFEELAITCRVEAAARAAGQGDLVLAEQACLAIPEGIWLQECHFRVGEELARFGSAYEALEHCVRAGRFGRFCLTHAGWGLPPEEGLDSRRPPAEVLASISARMLQVEQALSGAQDGLEGEGRDIFRSRLWYNLYLGTGVADPAPARAAPEDLAPYARGAFALEAVRLLCQAGENSSPARLAGVLAAWRGTAPAPTGQALPLDARHGRYNSPIPAPHEQDLPRVPIYGGGMRLVGLDTEEDLAIAVLEALYFLPETPADAFLPWLEDPRDRVRWTAVRLMRLAEPDQMDMKSTLTDLLHHADAGVRWNAADALKHETWKRRPGGYR